MLVHVFLVIGDYGFGNGLANGVDLGSMTTAGDTDADIDAGEFVETDDEDGFVHLIDMSMAKGGCGELPGRKDGTLKRRISG